MMLQLFGLERAGTKTTNDHLTANMDVEVVTDHPTEPREQATHKHDLPEMPAPDHYEAKIAVLVTKNPYAWIHSYADWQDGIDPENIPAPVVRALVDKWACMNRSWTIELSSFPHALHIRHEQLVAKNPRPFWALLPHVAPLGEPEKDGFTFLEEAAHGGTFDREFYLDHEYLEVMGWQTCRKIERELCRPWKVEVLEQLKYDRLPPEGFPAVGGGRVGD